MVCVAISQIGVLLSFAFVVLPAVSARSVFRGTKGVFAASAAIGAFGSIAGTLGSIHWDLPTGAAICVALAVPVPLALLIRRKA